MNKLLGYIISASLLLAAESVYCQIAVSTSNDIGIGTASPTFPLQFSKPQIRFTSFGNYGAGTNALHIDMQNTDPRINSVNKVVFYNLTSTGHIDVEARSYIQVSDERLKTNIKRIVTAQGESALGKVLQLNGYSYDWKDGMVQRSVNGSGNNHQIGFLAQEVEKIIPEAVVTADSSGVKAMSYNYIIPYLVEAIKEQQKTIEELKVLIAEKQRTKNASLAAPVPINTKKEE
ncbi:tail fiber domain-containing protein [Sphingobacterium sp.]|uniref:tail fiber domain-containing protein n=1 Tax=Sphingobacterium sp. TaxID=341027 RepID=UPI002FDB80D4